MRKEEKEMKKIKIYAPVDGVVRKLSYGKDAIFSKKILFILQK